MNDIQKQVAEIVDEIVLLSGSITQESFQEKLLQIDQLYRKQYKERKQYELMQDNDAHWYCVPVEYKDTFNEMMRIEWDEITKEGWKALDEWRVDGPHSVQFLLPEPPTKRS